MITWGCHIEDDRLTCMSRMAIYIISELLKVFAVTLAIMTVFVLFGIVAVEAVREGLSLVAILRMMPYAVPTALRFTIPGTVLFAVCLVYGRMAESNEITAAKSLGIPPWVLMRPALATSVVISALTVYLYDVAATWGTAGINRVILQSLEQIIYGRLRTQRSYSNSRGLSISVRDVQDERLIQTTLTYQPPDGSHPVSIYAEEAQIQLNNNNTALVITFRNMQIESEELRGFVPGEFSYEIPLSIATRKERQGRGISEIPLRHIRDEIEQTRRLITNYQQQLAARAAFSMASGDFDRLLDDAWYKDTQELESLRGRWYRLMAEPWRRWAAGFSCLCFVAVGVPLSILLRTADVWTTLGLCFLPILVLYYPLLMLGLEQAKSGAAPPAVVWLANVVFLAIGGWLIRRANR